MLFPKESGEYIVKHARLINVVPDGINRLVEEVISGLQSKTIDIENFSQHQHHPKPDDPKATNWIFVLDTLNFCFWTPDNETKWKVDNETGYFALCAAINRAVKEGVDITNPEFYSKIKKEELLHIFRSDDNITQIPLIEERVNCLHEVGTVLLEKYNGKFENCIKTCNCSAQNLLKLIVSEFPCFRDEGNYASKRVSFYKRAQILIGDVWACFRGVGIGKFDDIDTITMFADYRVPQVLIHFGALTYKKELNDILSSNKLLKNGEEAEIEIRGASIYIVEELKKKVLEEITNNMKEISAKNVNAVLLDHFLWDYRRRFAKDLEYIPFHKVLCVYY